MEKGTKFTKYTITLDEEAGQILSNYCTQTGATMSSAIRLAIKKTLSK